jgi:hypothetical protein
VLYIVFYWKLFRWIQVIDIHGTARTQSLIMTDILEAENTGGTIMKTKQALLMGLATTLIFAGCELTANDGSGVDLDLHGTWESTDRTVYSGILEIDFDTITIMGYAESQTPYKGDDSKRPFRDFAKNAPLPCYTEDGKLFIGFSGDVRSLRYNYSKAGQERYLHFTFGGRPEALKRTGN